MGMKIPVFKLVADENASNSLGELSALLTVGFGLHWAWVYTVMFATTRVFFVSIDNATTVTNHFYLISMICLALTLLIYGFNSRRTGVFLKKIPKQFIGFFLTVSTFALCTTNEQTVFGIISLFFAGIFTGIGSGTLLICWGECFSRKDTHTSTLNAALGIVVAMLIYVLLVYYLPQPVALVVAGCLPLIESVLVQKALRIKVSDEIPVFEKLQVRTTSFALHIGISSFIFGFALGILRSFSITSLFTSADSGSQVILLAGSFLAVPILISVILLLGRYEFGFLYRPIVAFIAIALLLTPLFGSEDMVIVNLILLIGYVCFEMMMWVAFAEISYNFRLSSIMVFGLGRATLTLGTLASALFAPYFSSDASSFFTTIGDTGTAVIAMAAMVLGYCLLPREKNIRDMMLPESEVETQAEKETSEEKRNYRFTHKCEKIATQYLLSKREAEVLYLLAKGRNAAYIKDELFISEGTVKTHIWRIYRKLNVHTQQELIDLIDQS